MTPLKWLIVNILGIILLSFILLYTFFEVYLPSSTHHGEAITVPDLKGMKVDKVKSYLEEYGLRCEIIDSTYSPLYKPNTIISQNPKSGSQVKDGRKIYLHICGTNIPDISIPDVINSSLDNARMVFQSNNLEVGEIRYVPHQFQNVVLKMLYNGESIEAGEKIPVGSKLDLEVSGSASNIYIAIPCCVGMNVDECKVLLKGYNLEVGPTIAQKRDTLESGEVFKQIPACNPNDSIKVGSYVDIWYAE